MFISLVGTSLGAILIGCVIAATIYGCTCYQMFSYWQNSRDSPRFRALITVVWLLDTIHMVFIAHAVYHYAVKNFGNPAALEESVWSVLAQVYLATWSDSIVRAVYCRRIWLLSGKNHLLVGCIVVTAVFTLVFANIFSSKMLMTMHTPEAAKNVFYIYITFGGLIACDVLIAGSLCIALSKHRSVFRSTNSLINIFILYTVNTSLLTTVCAIASLITAVVWPKNMVYLALIFNLSKLYVSSLLAALNSRQAIWEKCFGDPVQRSSVRMPGQTLSSSVVVKMERVVEVEDTFSKSEASCSKSEASDLEMQKSSC